MADTNYFKELNDVNVSEHIEKKGKLSYLSWVYAWGEIKKRYPNANYKVYESSLPDGWIVNYFTDGRTSFVKVGVTINDIEHIEYLPVMDNYNKSIPYDKMTSFDVNTAIQRALTKAIARHGLGLYIYQGEDLPQVEQENATKSSEDSKVVATQETQVNLEDLLIGIQTRYELLSEEDKDKLMVWCDGKGFGRVFANMHPSALGVIDKWLKNKVK